MFMYRARALLDYRLPELCLTAVYAVYDIRFTLPHSVFTLGEWAKGKAPARPGGADLQGVLDELLGEQQPINQLRESVQTNI